MKKQILSEEFYRMQKLAGIITESQYREKLIEIEEKSLTDPVAEKDAEEGLEGALSILKNTKVQPSPQDKELKEFEPVSITVGLLASAPGLLKGLGKVVNFISMPFKKDKKNGTKFGNAIAHAGEKLEDKYLRTIATLLQAGFPQTFPMPYSEDNELGKAAKKLYVTILVTCGVVAGLSAVNAHSLIASATEGGLAALKTAEAAELSAAIINAV